MLRKPFADEQYDDVSLYARIGYVVAHEFAHLTLLTGWVQPEMQQLLRRYDASVHVEAIADVVATLALVENNVTSGREMCAHVSQLWCARVPPGFRARGSHPAPNERGDHACDTLAELTAA